MSRSGLYAAREPSLPLPCYGFEMRNALIYATAARSRVVGCYAFWAWLRLGKSALLAIPGVVALAVFAYLLTRIDSAAAGRAYAAYGGIYIVASIMWLWAAEGVPPDRWDVTGAAILPCRSDVIISRSPVKRSAKKSNGNLWRDVFAQSSSLCFGSLDSISSDQIADFAHRQCRKRLVDLVQLQARNLGVFAIDFALRSSFDITRTLPRSQSGKRVLKPVYAEIIR